MTDAETDGLLEVSEIDTYYGDSHILHDVSMRIDEGEVVGLLGRNGAGKTTTLRSIIGVVHPRSGTIHYRGEDITRLAPNETTTRGISLIPEERRIFPNLTVRENLQVAKEGLHGTDEDMEQVFKLFPDLEEFEDRLGQNLSGGQQQMLAIGRGLIGDAELLLLDEPLEGLAPVLVEKVVDAISEIAEAGTTICLVEQNIIQALELVDRAYIIDNGQIVHEGASEEIRENEELIDRYLGVSVG